MLQNHLPTSTNNLIATPVAVVSKTSNRIGYLIVSLIPKDVGDEDECQRINEAIWGEVKICRYGLSEGRMGLRDEVSSLRGK